MINRGIIHHLYYHCEYIYLLTIIIAYAGAKRRRDRLNPTPWPENSDTPAAKSDNLFSCARRPTGSQPPRRSWLFGDAFPLSHRVAVYLDGIGIVHDTITDGVGQRWLADLGIPPGDGKL